MSIVLELKKTKETDLIEVCWYDIVSWGGWVKQSDDKTQPAVCYSYGFPIVVKEFNKKECLILSATRSGNNGTSEYNQHMTIPVDVIKSFKKIKSVKK